jgi:hypothetical protein
MPAKSTAGNTQPERSSAAFKVGDRVRTLAGARPREYPRREGTVTEVDSVTSDYGVKFEDGQRRRPDI